METPKSQLTAEQPQTEVTLKVTKKDTLKQRLKRSHNKKVGGDTIVIWSNPLPTGRMTHRLESNYTMEALLQEWKSQAPRQAFQSGGMAMGRGAPRESDFESQQGLITGNPRDRRKQTPLLEGTHKVLCAPEVRGNKKQRPHKRLVQTHLLVLEGLLWRWGAAVTHYGDKDNGSSSSGKYSLAWTLLEATISPCVGSSAGMPQDKQPTGQEHRSTNQQTGCLKFSRAQPYPPEGQDTTPPTSGVPPIRRPAQTS